MTAGHHTSASVTIDDPSAAIGGVRVWQSPVAEQRIVTAFNLGSVRVTAYEGYGCPPAALAVRLREIADEIDAAAAAMTPTQGDAVEAARTEGDAHRPAPASAVCDGGDGQDVAGAVVEADPAEEGDGVGAVPATALITTEHDQRCDADGWDHPGPCVLDEAEQPRHERMLADFDSYRLAGGVATFETWALRYGDNYQDPV